MENKELTLYDKNKIIERVSSLLEYYGKSEYKKEVIKAAHLLMDKVRYCDDEYITLESEFIEEILFTLNEDGTKSIVTDVYHLLRSINADLINVSFNNVHISSYHFGGLKNVEIDIQKIPNYDISKVTFDGVKLKGKLDGANIEWTNFTGYIGDLTLNPQVIQNKSLYLTNISGLTVKGSFDDVKICCMYTKGFKGEILINPQKVKEKDLVLIDFNGVRFVGDYDEKTGTYGEPCFDGCRIHNNNFKGCIGNIVIHLDKLCGGASSCNFTGVKLMGEIKDVGSLGLMHSYYEDENGKKIYFDDKKVNNEEPNTDEIAEKIINDDKVNNHKTRVRKPNFMRRIFGTSKK
ncbi:MAG: hypothetical protein IJZ46_06515 [Bacilli bacterium]|nr:hypothetical protein [Bacilli bacterium]